MSNVIWITGLSAAGKTTLAKILTSKLKRDGKAVVMLDGDSLREVLDVESVHDQKTRLDLAYKYARLSKMIADQGVIVIVSVVALFKEIHEWNRENLSSYFEVYLKVGIDELKRRDPKKIYSRYDSGDIINVAGLDLDFDEPLNPNLVLEYKQGVTPENELKIALQKLHKENYF